MNPNIIVTAVVLCGADYSHFPHAALELRVTGAGRTSVIGGPKIMVRRIFFQNFFHGPLLYLLYMLRHPCGNYLAFATSKTGSDYMFATICLYM
jgi:hypothetical protein